MEVTCLHDIPQQEYEENLRKVICHARIQEFQALLDTGSPDLAALALALNPLTRTELWPTLDDEMRGFVYYYESLCVDEESTQRMLNTVSHNVTENWYGIEAREIVDELIASIGGPHDTA